MDKNIKNIVFDFGGVLIEWDPRLLYKKVFSDKNEMEYFLSHICTPEWNTKRDAGESYLNGIADLQKCFPEYKELLLSGKNIA